MRKLDKLEGSWPFARILFFLTAIILSLGMLASLPRISIPLAIAYVFSLLIRPVLPWFYSVGLSKNISIIIIFIFLLISIVYPTMKFVPDLEDEWGKLQIYGPKLQTVIKEKYQTATAKLQRKTGIKLKSDLVEVTFQKAQKGIEDFLLFIPQLVALILEWFFLIPIFLYFILVDGKMVKHLYLKIVPNGIFERTYYLVYQFNRKVGNYIFAKFIEASIVGLIITIGLFMMGFPFSVGLGILAGITNIVPYIGPIIGFIPALIVFYIESGHGVSFGSVIILYLVANAIDMALVFPILVSKIVNLHPMLVVLSVIVGSQYWGIIGMIVSVPLAAILKLLIIEFYNELYPVDFSDN